MNLIKIVEILATLVQGADSIKKICSSSTDIGRVLADWSNSLVKSELTDIDSELEVINNELANQEELIKDSEKKTSGKNLSS